MTLTGKVIFSKRDVRIALVARDDIIKNLTEATRT
jgi:hypothetical protein